MTTPHSISVRVYYEDTDFTGRVYHASYLRFAERGRSDYLRELGISHKNLQYEEPPLGFAVSAMTIRFLIPAVIDDLLQVETRFTARAAASVEAEQIIRRNGEILWRAEVGIVCFNMRSSRPARLPEVLNPIIAGLPILRKK